MMIAHHFLPATMDNVQAHALSLTIAQEISSVWSKTPLEDVQLLLVYVRMECYLGLMATAN